jgi:hypothetical protein
MLQINMVSVELFSSAFTFHDGGTLDKNDFGQMTNSLPFRIQPRLQRQTLRLHDIGYAPVLNFTLATVLKIVLAHYHEDS